MMQALIRKDFQNGILSCGPALLMGLSLALILQFAQDDPKISAATAFWVIFFFSTSSLFYRSFGLEHRFHNFQIYSALGIPRLRIFLSQTLVHLVFGIVVGCVELFLVGLFWSQPFSVMLRILPWVGAALLCLCPLGTFLGLILQRERELLFSVIYLPLATPVILAAYHQSLEASAGWLSLLGVFFAMLSFFSAFLFEIFFDELT